MPGGVNLYGLMDGARRILKGRGGQDSLDRLGLVVPAVDEGIISVFRGGGDSPGLLLEEGGHILLRERRAAGGGKGKDGGHCGSTFQGKQRTRAETVMVRTRSGVEGNVVDLLVKLFEHYRSRVLGGRLPHRWPTGVGRGVEGVGEKTGDILRKEWAGEGGGEWRSQGTGAMAELIPEEFALHSGKIGEAQGLE